MKDGSAISQNFVSSNSLVFEVLDPVIIVEICLLFVSIQSIQECEFTVKEALDTPALPTPSHIFINSWW
jgi:hypothetical protein